MTLIRCYACRILFNKELPACPECDARKRSHNEALVSQRWRSNLNAQAAHTDTH